MADYRGKANKLEKKIIFCVTASKGLNGPYFTHFPLLKFFYQGDDLSDESCKVWHCYSIYLW